MSYHRFYQGSAPYAKQQGAVLAVSLIILLVMTIFGITSMNTSILQEKMASNSLNTNRTFQASESATREVINEVTGGNQGLLTEAMNDPDLQTQVHGYTTADPELNASYQVTHLGEIIVHSGNSLDADESSTILRGQRFEIASSTGIEGSNARTIIRTGVEYR